MTESPTCSHRPIRSYVLRQGRMTEAQQRAFETLWPRYGLTLDEGVLDLPALFGNDRPVTLEIGFGNGEALAQQAQRHPERNYLGVEVHSPGVGHLMIKLIVRPEFAELIHRVLMPGGLLHMATDWEDYAGQMLNILSDHPGFINQAGDGQFAPRPEDRPLTKFEQRGQRLGHGVWDLLFERQG
ncbi:MAG: tRNA (guanosine(46)-N(7))-methyltransferase TrmB [Candidatus Thiodiazotropha sp.]